MARKAGKISIFTMADELGVSASTISRVINNRAGVGEATRRAVLELLRKYDFKVNYPQQHLPKIAIPLTVYSGVSGYTGRVLSGIYEYLASRGLTATTILFDSKHPASLLEMVRDQQCAGVILISQPQLARQLPELAASGLPVMQIDEQSASPEIGFIDNDSYSGAANLVKHLLALGHRKIGFLLRWPGNLNHIQRLNGYRNTLREAGIALSDRWIRQWDDARTDREGHGGGILFEELLAADPEITAVMAVNDEIALEALHTACRRGIRVPEEISITGFDNDAFSALTIPELTTVYHPSLEAGRRAAEAVADYLASNGKTPLPKEILPTRLIVRRSTGPVRRGLLQS